MRVRNFREGKEKWIRGTVVERLGPVSYLINDGVRERTFHIDHLLLSHEEVMDCNNASEPLKSKETVSFFVVGQVF